MNELERHIEILLLTNDCVIVPNLGGFVAHHICARYVEDEGLYLPPLRTLGFNPQLKMNDSLLAQSYAEAYDMSLPEALDHIEAEVARLRQQLADNGEVELSSLGRLYVNADGQMAFAPCEAGILTPSLYALSSFEMRKLEQQIEQKPAAQVVEMPAPSVAEETEPAAEARAIYIGADQSGRKTINISLRALRNTAAAAAVIAAMFLLPAPLSRHGEQFAQGSQSELVSQISSTINGMMEQKPDTARVKIRKAKKASGQSPKLQQKMRPMPVQKGQLKAGKAVQPSVKAEELNLQRPQEKLKLQQSAAPQAGKDSYSIVLCSHVSQKGAEEFAKKAVKDGLTGAKAVQTDGINKVVCGNFSTMEEAQQALSKLRANSSYQQCWVMKETK